MKSATQSVPRFIQEITDVYVKEGESAVFECSYSGNPVPDVVWYKNDKLITNTDNVKIRLLDEEKRTMLTIKHATEEDDATYVCKATSEIGLAISKAKLRVTDITGEWRFTQDEETVGKQLELKSKKKPEEEKPHKKKKPELRKAKETKEKIKAERVKTEKKEIYKEKLISKEQPEEKKIVDIEETQVLETTEIIKEEPEKLTRAKKVVQIQEPLITEATASLKKIDDQKPREMVPKVEEHAKRVVKEHEGVVVVSEIATEDVAPDFLVESKIDSAQVTSETLQTVTVSEVHTETSIQEIKRTEAKQKKAKKTLITQEQAQVRITEIPVEEKHRVEAVEEKPKKKKTKVKIREEVTVEEIVEKQKENIAREVEEIMEVLHAKEFGPGESPLRELATIGYLVRQGVTVNEINESLYRTDNFPALRTPDAQNALVQLVEREGHGPLITQVLTEETTTDESIVAATVGFRAFMRMVELQHATVEEVLTHFAPEDFRPRAWEVTEITEVESEQRASERVDVIHKAEVHVMERREERKTIDVQDIREIKEYEDTRQAHTLLRKRKDRKLKDQIEKTLEDRDEGVQVIEIEEVEETDKKKKQGTEEIEEEIIIVERDSKGRLTQKQRDKLDESLDIEVEEENIQQVRKLLKSKKLRVGDDEIQLEEIEDLEDTQDYSVPSMLLNVPSQRHQIVPLDRITEQAPDKAELETATFTVDTATALTGHIISAQDKEIEDIKSAQLVERRASVSISAVEPYSTTEITVQVSTGEYIGTPKYTKFEATPGIISSEGLVVSETLPSDADVSKLSLVKQEASRKADVSVTVQEATTIYETMVNQSEVPTEDFVSPLTAKAEDSVLSQIGVSVYEVQEGLSEEKLEPTKTVGTKPRVNITTIEPLLVEEVHAEDKPGKYYPELIVPTEIATRSIISQKQCITEEMHAPEKEGEYIPGRLPPSQKAQLDVSYENETAVVQQDVIQESEGVFVSSRKVETFNATPSVTLLEGVSVSTVEMQHKESNLTVETGKTVTADLNIVENTSAVMEETIVSEKEQDRQESDKPSSKCADTSISPLEIGSIMSTVVQESEGIYSADQKPTRALAETSIRPEEHVLISEIQTADYPSEFKEELKYVSESGTLSVQLTEAKMVHETLTHDREGKMEESVKPEERKVEMTYDAVRSVEIFQATSTEKEADLRIFEMPESHRGKPVPSHPVVHLEISETHPEGHLGETIKETPSSAMATIKAISLQETVVGETIVAENLMSVKEDKVPESKVAQIAVTEIDSIRTTMVVADEKESEYTRETDVKQVYASAAFTAQFAPVLEEVRTESPTDEYVAEQKPASIMAQQSHIPMESITVAVQETAEKEDIYKTDVRPDQKTAVLELTEARTGPSVLEIIPHDLENAYTPDAKPQDYKAQTLVSGRRVALKSETLAEISAGTVSIDVPKTSKAIRQQEPLEELIVTETNIGEAEKVREEDTKPVTQSAEIEVCSKLEKLMITEVTAALSEEKLSVIEVPNKQKVRMDITSGREVAEMEETVLASNVNILRQEKAKEECATQQQSGLDVVQQTEVSVSEKESPLQEDIKPDSKRVAIVFQEGESVVVAMTHPEDKEGTLVHESKPDKMEATIDFVTHGVASKYEVVSDTDLSEYHVETTQESKPKTTLLPIEAIVSEEVQTRETEAPLSEVKLIDRKANLQFVVGESLIVSSVTAEDREAILPVAEKPAPKSAISDILTHVVAETAETNTTDNIGVFKREEAISAMAKAKHLTFVGVIASEISTADLELPMEDFVNPDKKIIDVTFEEDVGLTITETITSDKEREYLQKLELQEEKATLSFDGHKVAQLTEVTAGSYPGELEVSIPAKVSAKEEHLSFESVIQTETITSETEKEFKDKPVATNIAVLTIDELVGVTTSTETPADKEDILRIPEIPTEKTASIEFGGHAIAEKTEVTVDSSAGELEDIKPQSASAMLSSVPLEAIVRAETQPSEAEGTFVKDTMPTQAAADLSIVEKQSIQVISVTLEDKESEYKMKELPETRMADKGLVDGHVVAETAVQVVDVSTGNFIREKPSTSTITPQLIPYSPLIKTQPVVQESEDTFVPVLMPHDKVAGVNLAEGKNVVLVSQVIPADKESLYISEKQPAKRAAICGLDTTHTIAESITVDVEDSVTKVNMSKPDAKVALPSQEMHQSVLVTQDFAQDQEKFFEGKFQPEIRMVETSIEEGKRVITVTEISVADKENTFDTIHEGRVCSTLPAVIAGHEVAEKSEVVASLSTGEVEITTPFSAIAHIGQKPFECVELTEQILAEKETETVKELILHKTNARVAVDENRFVAITESTITQDGETELSATKRPRGETAKTWLEGKEIAEHMEISLEDSLGEIPRPSKQITFEAHPSQTVLDSIDVSETIPQEQGIIFADKFKCDERSANICFVEGKSLTVNQVIAQDKEDDVAQLKYEETNAAMSLTKVGMDIAQKVLTFIQQSTGSLLPFDKTEVKAHHKQDALEPIIVEEIAGVETEGMFDRYPKTIVTTAIPKFEEEHGISVTAITLAEAETVSKEKKLDVSQTAESTIMMESGTIETIVVESQVDIPDKQQREIIQPQTAVSGQDTFESIIVQESIVEESEKTFESIVVPKKQKADVDVQDVKPLEISEIIVEDRENILDVAYQRQEVKATQDIGLFETVQKSMIESIHNTGKVEDEKRVLFQAILTQPTQESVIKTETTVVESEGTLESEEFLHEQHKSKPQVEGLSTISVVQVISHEAEGILPETIAPKEQQAHPNLLGREVPEILQIIPASTLDDLAKSNKLEEQQGKLTMAELTSVTVSEIVHTEAEDTITGKAIPKDQKAAFNIAGREVAETSEVTTIVGTEDIDVIALEERRGKPKLDERTSLTVSQVVLDETEGVLLFPAVPTEKIAELSLLSRDVAETMQILTVSSAEEFAHSKAPIEQRGKPELEELSSLTVSQVMSHETEDIIPSSEIPCKKEARANIFGRDVAQTMEVLTISTVNELTEVKKPESQKGTSEVEEIVPLTVSQTVSSEIEEALLSAEMPSEKTAQSSLLGRDVAETSQVLTISSTKEFTPSKAPDLQRGKPELEELSSLTISQVMSHESEEVLASPEVLSQKEARSNIIGRDAAETMEILTISTAEEFTGRSKPGAQTGIPRVEEHLPLTISHTVFNEMEEALLSAEIPSKKIAQPGLLGRDVAETSQVITMSSTQEFAASKIPDQQKGMPELEELLSLTISQIISHDTEEDFTSPEVPTQKEAQLNVFGRDVAQTMEVLPAFTVDNLTETSKPEKRQGILGIEELAPLTVLQTVSSEAEHLLPSAEVPVEKTAHSTLLGRDVAETIQVLTVSNTEEFALTKAPDRQKSKPELEELSSLTISQVISQEVEEDFPSPEVPTQREAKPSISVRDIAEMTEVLTVSNVEELAIAKTPGEEKGIPSLEEFKPLTISQTVPSEMEEILLSVETLSEKTAQPSLLGADVAETTEIQPMLSAGELLKPDAPEKHTGKPQLEELAPLTVIQILSHETETTLQKPVAPEKLTAQPSLAGREVAETNQVFTVTNVEDLQKSKTPQEQKGKPQLDELSSITVSQIVPSELEEILSSPEKPSEKLAQSNLKGREVAEKMEVLTVTNVEELSEHEKPDRHKGYPDVEEMTFVTVSEVISTETEKDLPNQETPKQRKALTKISSFEVPESSEVVTAVIVEELLSSRAPEEQKGTPIMEEFMSLSVSEVAFSEVGEGLLTPEEPVKQIAEPNLVGIRVAEKSEVISTSMAEQLFTQYTPETKSVSVKQLPFETVEQSQAVPQESENTLVLEKMVKPTTAEVSFRVSEGLEVTQVVTTEKESKEVIKGVAKEASAQPDVIQREIALKTEVLPEDAVLEFDIRRPDSKTARGVEEEKQGVIVTELETISERESDLPISVTPFAKLANVSIEAEQLDHVVEITEAPAQHHITITQHKTEHDMTQQPSIESDTEVMEEYTTKFKRGSRHEEIAPVRIKRTIIRKKTPKTEADKDNVVVIEEELEDYKSALPTIPKKQFMHIEEVTSAADIEEIAPSKIEEVEDTSQKTDVKVEVKVIGVTETDEHKKITKKCITRRHGNIIQVTEETTVEEEGKAPVITLVSRPIETLDTNGLVNAKETEEIVHPESTSPLKQKEYVIPQPVEAMRGQVTVTEILTKESKPTKILKKSTNKGKRTKKKETEETNVEELNKKPVTTITEGPVEEIV
ncbi:hypothetical protein KM043_013352, partial [Ampulex compressa]